LERAALVTVRIMWSSIVLPSNHTGIDGLFAIGYGPDGLMRRICFRNRGPMQPRLELAARPLFNASPSESGASGSPRSEPRFHAAPRRLCARSGSPGQGRKYTG